MASLIGGIQEGFPEEVTCAESGLMRKSQPCGEPSVECPWAEALLWAHRNQGQGAQSKAAEREARTHNVTCGQDAVSMCVGVCTGPEMCVDGRGR